MYSLLINKFSPVVLKIYRSSVIRNIGITFVSKILSRFLTAVSIIILLRVFSQADIGELALFQSIVIIASGVIMQGLNLALIRKTAYEHTNKSIDFKFIQELLYSTIFLSIVISFVIIGLFAINKDVFGSNNYISVHQYFIVGAILFTALMNFSIAYFQAVEKFKLIALLTIAQSVIIVIIFLVFSYFQIINIPLVFLVISVIPLLTFIIFIKDFNFIKDKISLKDFASILNLIKNYRWDIKYTSLIVIASQLDILMLSRFFDLGEVGIYSVASKLYSIFLIVLYAMHTVLLPKFSSIKNKSELRNILLKSMKYTIPSSILLIIIIFIFSNQLIYLFAGITYDEANNPFKILTISAGISIVLSPSINVLFSLNKIKLITISTVILISVALICHFFITRNYGAFGCAVSTLIAYSSQNIFLFIFSLRYTSQKQVNQ